MFRKPETTGELCYTAKYEKLKRKNVAASHLSPISSVGTLTYERPLQRYILLVINSKKLGDVAT